MPRAIAGVASELDGQRQIAEGSSSAGVTGQFVHVVASVRAVTLQRQCHPVVEQDGDA